jgi:phosphoenolpyruvate synthase/pyruvate phosphate dikinase
LHKLVRYFADISKQDVAMAGGKGASLGAMTQAGLPVPPGFVILAPAFDQYAQTGAPPHLIDAIGLAFDALGAEHVAVRSSATAEDSDSAAWAGQLESYLYTPRAAVVPRVQQAWQSLFSERAKAYRSQQGLQDTPVSVAVVVQQMITAGVSGVAFTANPITGDRTELMIEAVYGDNELLVSGQVTPDNYLLHKSTGKLLGSEITPQTSMSHHGQHQTVTAHQQSQAKLSPDMLLELAGICRQVEAYFAKPMDIEWVHDGTRFYLVQARPITTLTLG